MDLEKWLPVVGCFWLDVQLPLTQQRKVIIEQQLAGFLMISPVAVLALEFDYQSVS